MESINFKDLTVKHDYYCNDSNYYSNEAAQDHETWQAFESEYADADIDLNLIFRWDIYKKEEEEGYFMQIFMMHQRKGRFVPHWIKSVTEEDTESIKALFRKHYDKLQRLWSPFSGVKLESE